MSSAQQIWHRGITYCQVAIVVVITYGSWIYDYLCTQSISPLTLWVQILLRRGVRTRYNENINTNETDCQYKTEILLKVALNTIILTLFPVPHYVEFNKNIYHIPPHNILMCIFYSIFLEIILQLSCNEVSLRSAYSLVNCKSW